MQLLLLFLLIASQVDFVVGCFMGPQDDTEKAQGFIGLDCEYQSTDGPAGRGTQ